MCFSVTGLWQNLCPSTFLWLRASAFNSFKWENSHTRQTAVHEPNNTLFALRLQTTGISQTLNVFQLRLNEPSVVPYVFIPAGAELCRSSLAVLVWSTCLLMLLLLYFQSYVTCPPEWLQFLSSPNWMHWPLHHARWVGNELWSAVPEIALMISIRRDQGLLEGYCTGGLMKRWGLLWESERRFWIMMMKTFICLSSCTIDGDTHMRGGKKDAPQDIFLSDEQRN